MQATLKHVTSETVLPVQAGPGAAPDEEVSSSDGDFATGHRTSQNRLKEAFGAVKVRCTLAAEFVQAKAASARSTVSDVLDSARISAVSYAQAGQEKFTGATSGVKARFSSLLCNVAETRAIATNYVLKIYGEGTAIVLNTLQGGRARATSSAQLLQEKVAERTAQTRSTCVATYDMASEKAVQATTVAKAKAVEVSSAARDAAADPRVQCTAASAAGGAVAVGATGGATGLAAGSAIGAAVGVVPALFTFGLSIPIGAAIGGGAGLVMGTAVGSTVGAVGGGAAGYKAYSNKDEIRSSVSSTMTKVGDASDYVKDSVSASASSAKEVASKLRARLVGNRQ